MVIVHIYNPTYWNVWLEGTPYNANPKTLLKAKEWASAAKADCVYNLAYFNMSNGNTVNYVKAKGYDVGYGGIEGRVTVSSGNVCGGYAIGIEANEVTIKADGTARTRNGIGVSAKGNIIVAQSNSKITERNFCKEVAIQVNQYHKDTVKLFLMEDGGGSTQMYSSISRLGIAPEGGRRVPTVVCVKRKVPVKISRTLKVGCTGEDVRYYQMILGGLVCDGSFGNACYKRTKESQRALKVAGLYTGEIDGIAGPGTLKALGMV